MLLLDLEWDEFLDLSGFQFAATTACRKWWGFLLPSVISTALGGINEERLGRKSEIAQLRKESPARNQFCAFFLTERSNASYSPVPEQLCLGNGEVKTLWGCASFLPVPWNSGSVADCPPALLLAQMGKDARLEQYYLHFPRALERAGGKESILQNIGNCWGWPLVNIKKWEEDFIGNNKRWCHCWRNAEIWGGGTDSKV